MANIDAELNAIINASKGEDVRAAIVSAITAIHNEKEYPPTTLKVESNGTYEETGFVWNKVIVDVPEGGSNVSNIDDLGQHITDNGYYTLPILKEMGYIENENCIGINGFFVDVPQVAANLGEKNITENGVYDPLTEGFDGYSKIYVNVMGGEGKPGDMLTVRFFDSDGTLLQQKQVPYGTNFSYDGNTPSKGGTFTGWNPSLQTITRSQDFYAVYGTAGGLAGEIDDTWQQIVTKMAAKQKAYPIGSKKSLAISDGTNLWTLPMVLVAYEMDNAAEGGKAFSTWISDVSTTLHTNANSIFRYSTYDYNTDWRTAVGYNKPDAINWENSLMRANFNADPSKLLGPADVTEYNSNQNEKKIKLPTMINAAAGFDLWKSIKKVKKVSSYSEYVDSTMATNVIYKANKTTADKIWLPSTYEIFGSTWETAASSADLPKSSNNCNYESVKSMLTGKGNMFSREVYARADGWPQCQYWNTSISYYRITSDNPKLLIGFCL